MVTTGTDVVMKLGFYEENFILIPYLTAQECGRLMLASRLLIHLSRFIQKDAVTHPPAPP
jgi:hypothetical protein